MEPVTREMARRAVGPGDLLLYLPRMVRLFWRLFFDRRVGHGARAVLLFGLGYGISLIDFLPDLMPVLGQVDDLTMLLGAGRLFLHCCPREVVWEHARAIDPSGGWTPPGAG